MVAVDLTPFGFTPTESRAYAALLEQGPLSGYALAKGLAIARANAYQALEGLVRKRVVTPTDDRPQRYRPVQPGALLAMMVERETSRLDRLQAQLSEREPSGQPAVVALTNRRALEEVALRAAARSPGELMCVGPGALLESLAPAWHKRRLDGLPTSLWVLGESTAGVAPTGRVPEERVERWFGGPAFLMHTERGAVAARVARASASGYWSEDPVLVGAIRGALSALVGS